MKPYNPEYIHLTELRARAPRIAEALQELTGQQWHVDTESELNLYLLSASGLRIRLLYARTPNRIEVWACYPPDLTRFWPRLGLPVDDITVSVSRSDGHIASDIARKLLPRYIAGELEAREYQFAEQQMNDYQRGMAECLAKVVEGTADTYIQGRFFSGNHPTRPYACGEVSMTCGVSLDLRNLDPETAAEILEIVARSECFKA